MFGFLMDTKKTLEFVVHEMNPMYDMERFHFDKSFPELGVQGFFQELGYLVGLGFVKHPVRGAIVGAGLGVAVQLLRGHYDLSLDLMNSDGIFRGMVYGAIHGVVIDNCQFMMRYLGNRTISDLKRMYFE